MIYDSPISYSIHLVIYESESSPASPPPRPFPLVHTPTLTRWDPWPLLCPFTYLLHIFSLVELISEKPINYSSSVIKHLQYGIMEALQTLWNLSRRAAVSLILAFLFLPQTHGVYPLLSPHRPLCLWPTYLPGVIVQKFLRCVDLEGENLSL